MNTKVTAILTLLTVTLPSRPQQPTQSILNSPHNLSATGPGRIRAGGEQQVCIFCHTPHSAAPIQPLWNRNVPVSAYRPYSSKSLDALPSQPTGTSKLCLSCHDGTIALGSVLSRNQPIQMAGGLTTLPPGKSNLGTDLSDDHPISFRYDAALAAKDPKLRDPASLPEAIKLDANQELQCTTCHEPHDNSRGNFLVMTNTDSQLCNSCHRPGLTNVPQHNNCNSCHQPHSAPSGPFLLRAAKVTGTCLECHSGTPSQVATVQGPNVAPDINKISRHDTNPPVNLPDHIPNNTHCSDCHEPHTMKSGGATAAPNIPLNFGDIPGVTASGSPIAAAKSEYEVCFKCHADQAAAVQPYVSRKINQTNTRLEFAPSAVSFHPVQLAGKNNDVPSLRPGLTTASMIYCSDCHSSDNSKKAGGAGPNGTHGSNYRPLLIAGYDTIDGATESAESYALCYKCHTRTSILADESFKAHKRHIVDQKTPCSACHDAHGIPSAQGNAMNNSHLINFDTRIVRPDSTGRLEFIDKGIRRGQCFLSCHNRIHNGTEY
jgi:predicted CXXCH cytochrome family protein